MSKGKDYRKHLVEALKDPAEAAEYLNEALVEDDISLFLTALRNVADARSSISALARETNLNRENLYKMLSKHGNPQLTSLSSLLEALGLKICIVPRPSKHWVG